MFLYYEEKTSFIMCILLQKLVQFSKAVILHVR